MEIGVRALFGVKRRSALFLLVAAILVTGLAGGAAIYVLGEEPEAQAYVIVGDTAYPVDPTSSKTYVRNLERYGGKMAVLSDEVSHWLAERFQGKQLGITVAVGSVVAALVLFLAARRIPY